MGTFSHGNGGIDAVNVFRVRTKNQAITGEGQKMTLHGLRRFSPNRLAKTNLLAAQA